MTDPTARTEQEWERRRVLKALGADSSERDELLAYNANRFSWETAPSEIVLPLAAEPAVAAWSAYEREAREAGAFAVLREKLVQLHFPIRAGISKSREYRAATRRGVSPEDGGSATGLALEQPNRIELMVHPTAAGPIPLIVAEHRTDFAALVQALSWRNEPVDVPAAQGACVIGGLVNWDRVKTYRRRWERDHPRAHDGEWSLEFGRLAGRKELYQDRLILLSTTPYSAVPAQELALDDDRWRELSLILRREHECAHYFTRRVLGHMANNALDELIADYAGIHAAAGDYRVDWFLRFVGLENPASDTSSGGPDESAAGRCGQQPLRRHRAGARLEIYRADPPLSDRAFGLLGMLLRSAANNLALVSAELDRDLVATPPPKRRVLMIAALSRLTLELIAEEHDGAARLHDELGVVRRRIRFREASV